MNYGLYLSASGVATNLYRQDVFANNLANVETVGFKRDLASIAQRSPEAIEDNFFDYRHDLLDRLGGGALAGPQRISLQQGAIKPTNSPLDLALESSDGFFTVGQIDEQTGQMGIRLTRNGAFTLNRDGVLVNEAGLPVLDEEDRPIALQLDLPVHVTQTGDVMQNDAIIARLGITSVSDPDRLVKQGGNLLSWAGQGDIRTEPASYVVRQGALEASNVDPIKALMDVINATKAVSTSGNLIRYHDTLMDRAVNTLGRVVA